MDTMEGRALVEDNRSSGVGERQGSQPRMRGATQTLLPFPGIAQPLECPNFIGLGISEPRNDLSIKIRELDARQRGKAVLLATQEEASRASREPVDEEEAMAQAWWEGAREPGEPIGTEQNKTEGTNLTRIIRDSPSSVATATTSLESGPATSQSRQFRSVPKCTMQQPLRPMMDAQQREQADLKWAVAQR
ncbi:hypothetical protein R1flu_027164 [Riccia fluitans]|uniref:Uncharacterized protein n=1 Tax=Riccia fluitans TaxID=41844 RepID=A0ABD1XL22_9MARC